MNDPPTKPNSSHAIPTSPQPAATHESDRVRLISDLAFLVVQFHRRRQRTTSRTDPTRPNASSKCSSKADA